MQNEAAQKAYVAAGKQEIGIKEANLFYFGFLMLCSAMPMLLPMFFGIFSVDASIGLSLASLFLAIILYFITRSVVKKNPRLNALYLINFLMTSLSVMFSVLAISKYYNAEIRFFDAFYISLVLALLGGLDLVILSTGKKERTLFSLGSLTFVGGCIYGIVVISSGDYAFGIPMLAFSLCCLTLHLSMLIYVCNDSGFFAIMSFFFLLAAMIALIVALIIVSAQGGDCSCDCGDCCSAPEGGRRGKLRKNKLPPIINQ